jgi:hypothetical protein
MTVSDKSGLDPLLISCCHGQRPSAVICGHMLVQSDQMVGFVENSSDPTDLQAWCEACEQLFLNEGGKTPSFMEFNQMTLVCDICYSNLKDRHGGITSPT